MADEGVCNGFELHITDKADTDSPCSGGSQPYKAYKHLKTKVTLGDEKFQKVMLKEPPRLFPPVRLILSILVAFCCSTANGYDSSLFGSELANPRFTDYFNVHNAGIGSGTCASSSLHSGPTSHSFPRQELSRP